MKTSTTPTTGILGRWTHVLGSMLIFGLLVPASALAQSSPAVVNLGTAGDFVILAKTAASTTGTTAVTGDIGISPAAASFITGYGLIMDASTTFATSSLVTGKIYATNYTPPTPAKMTTAISDMQTAYTNAAGRTLPDYTELYAGDVTGKTLTRGLYKWGTGVQISAGGVMISGSATDVWIFQVAQNLTVANGAIITLSGGALASNIFWQVAGQVTLGTTVQMKGIILCQTQIAMNTGATLNGRALAQTAVTLIANTVTQPAAATAGSATTIALMSGNNQTGAISSVLANSFVVTVSDVGGNPVQGTSVTFAISSIPSGATGQSLSTTTTTTNASGQASSRLTLGSNAGTYSVTAASQGLSNSPITFSATASTATSVENGGTPKEFSLSQNYPNPFNPSTEIDYSLEKASQVSLRVYNLLGNEVATLVNGRQDAGNYSVSFNTNKGTLNLTSGIYFYRLEAGSFVSMKKLILMK